MELSLPALIGLLTATPFVLAYWLARAVARLRLGVSLREPRPLAGAGDEDSLRRWLVPGAGVDSLPARLSLAEVAADWVAADPSIMAEWRAPRGFDRAPILPAIRSLWETLPEASQGRSEPLLRRSLARRESAWSAAAAGWTERPFALPAPPSRRAEEWPAIEIVPDLTSAPVTGPIAAREAASDAEAWLLPVLISLQLRAPVARVHPLEGPSAAGLADVGARVAGDVGRSIGTRVGGMLGPIGASLGGYVGGLLGSAGGKQLARTATTSLGTVGDAHRALEELGDLAVGEPLDEAAAAPAECWLARGIEWESVRCRRRTRFSEFFWPSPCQALGEECVKRAAAELRAVRASQGLFLKAARGAAPAVRGGILLQNPWLAGGIPGAPEALSAARAALNQAAREIAASGGE